MYGGLGKTRKMVARKRDSKGRFVSTKRKSTGKHPARMKRGRNRRYEYSGETARYRYKVRKIYTPRRRETFKRNY